MTKPQDILVALKICLSGLDRTFAVLARELGMSTSEVHASCSRLIEARLLDPGTRKIRRAALLEFLRFGVPYAYPAQPREVTRGIPTAWAAPVMAGKTVANEDMIPVWPAPDGTRRGAAVDPLYRSVPACAGAHVNAAQVPGTAWPSGEKPLELSPLGARSSACPSTFEVAPGRLF